MSSNNFVVELTAVIVFVSSILGLWWRVETRISQGALDALEKIDELEKDFNTFKLHVAENYVKSGLLKEVEVRIIERMGAIVTELHGLRDDFKSAMFTTNTPSSPKRRKSS